MAQTIAGAAKCAAKKLGLDIHEYLALLASGQKRCTKCKAWKGSAEFGMDSSRWDGKSATCFQCGRVSVRVCTKGRTSAFKGCKHTPEARKAMSESAKAHPSNRIGKKHTAETKSKISKISKERTPRGACHYAFSHGRFQRSLSDRRKPEYKEWRDAVYARDNYTCQICGDAKGGNLQAHHVKDFANHPDLRFVVSNGLTVCQSCHEKIHLKPIPTPSDMRRRKKHKS